MSEEKKSSPVTPPSLFQFENIWRAVSVPLVAVLLALLIGALILILSGANPIQAYAALIKGSFGSTASIGRTLEKATPLIFGGLAVALGFRGGLFNIGAQGQLLLGALVRCSHRLWYPGVALVHPCTFSPSWRRHCWCAVCLYSWCIESIHRCP